MKDSRRQSLDITLQRMSNIAGVFRGRSAQVEGARWKQFDELLQIYIEGCRRALKEDGDYVDDGPQFTDEEMDEARQTFDFIFTGQLPGDVE